jgi:hypothetical protein
VPSRNVAELGVVSQRKFIYFAVFVLTDGEKYVKL